MTQDSQTLTADLKPCPFCGGTNLYAYRNIGECRNPDCGGSGPDVGDTQLTDAAKDAWNTRSLPDAPSPTDLAQWEELVEPLRAEIVAAGIDPLRLDAVVSGVPRLLWERDDLLRKASGGVKHEPGMGWKLSDEAAAEIDRIVRQNVHNAAKVGNIVMRSPAPSPTESHHIAEVSKMMGDETASHTPTKPEGRKFDLSTLSDLDEDLWPIVRLELRETIGEEKYNAFVKLLSPVSDPTDTVTVKREIYGFLMGAGPLEGVHFGERHPDERGAFWWRSRLRASINGGADV